MAIPENLFFNPSPGLSLAALSISNAPPQNLSQKLPTLAPVNPLLSSLLPPPAPENPPEAPPPAPEIPLLTDSERPLHLLLQVSPLDSSSKSNI